MKQIKLLSMHIQNFKGCKDRTIEFGEKTRITGDNGVGKSTVFDAYLWLLFDKNSKGVTNFAVRPLAESGETINNIEILVEATISVDNDEYKLRKTQKQKWVKKRGTDTREFQGNVNEFDINGYPKSQKEFKEFISGIVNEEVFPLISNPAAFTSLPWKEQRDILMQFVGDVSSVLSNVHESVFVSASHFTFLVLLAQKTSSFVSYFEPILINALAYTELPS